MITSRVPLFHFSAFKNIAKKTFDKFNTRYSANVEAFRQKVDATSSAKVNI